MKSFFKGLGVLFVVFYFWVLIWTNFVKQSKVEEMTMELITSWTDNDYETAVQLGDQMFSPSFQKKENHRAACGILDEKTADYNIKTLGMARVLYFVTEWSDIKRSAVIHVNFELREMSLYYMLSLIKTGQVEKAKEVFSWYQTHPLFHNDTWKVLDIPLVTESIASFLKYPEKKESMAMIDMVSLFMGDKYGDDLINYGNSPWGTPYQIYVNKQDPINASRNLDDFFSDNPFFNYTCFIFTPCDDGSYFTFSTEDHSFYNKHPEDVFTFLTRLNGFDDTFFFQTQGSAISAFMYYMNNQALLKEQPDNMPFFITDKGEMSILWDDFLKFTNEYRQAHDDWVDKIQFTFSDNEDVPTHLGYELSLLQFEGGEPTAKYVLPFNYGDTGMDGTHDNPKAFFNPPHEECNTPDVIQTIIDHPSNSDGNDLSIALSKLLIQHNSFHAPLQITYDNSEVHKNMILIFPRYPRQYPTWILYKRRSGHEPITQQEIKLITQNLSIPDSRLKTSGDQAIIKDTQRDIYFYTLNTSNALLFYWTDQASDDIPEMAQWILDLAVKD